MSFKSIKYALSLIGALGMTAGSAGASEVRFVKSVDPGCKHLGEVRQMANNDAMFDMWKAFAVVDAGPVFADGMRGQARAMGANCLVVVDIFHNKTITTGARVGYVESVDATQLRARAFHCP